MMGISLGSKNSSISIQTRLSLRAGGQADFPSFCEHNPQVFSLETKGKYNQKKFHFCSISCLALNFICPVAWENSQHFVTPSLVSLQNDVYRMTTEIPTGKNNGFPFLDILGYLKNTHKNPKFGKVRQVPTREFPTKFPDWDLSHSSKFGIFVGIL